jgi:predicted PurR-regulated permease PerM
LHNRQHLQINNNKVSKLAVIVLSIALITGISFVPVLQTGVYAQRQPQPLRLLLQQQQPAQQQQQQQQPDRIGISQVIKQIAQQVASANPGTTENHYIKYLYNWLSEQLFSVFLLD